MLAMQKNQAIRAIIVGSAGQDGFYLERSLLADGIETVGITRSGVLLPWETTIRPFSLLDPNSVSSLVKEVKPQQIYYLPAYHHSSESKLENTNVSLKHSIDIHVVGLTNFLDAMRRWNPKARLFYAASSHVFGDPIIVPQTEETPFRPINVYGITKAAGIELCRLYRKQHGLHCSNGILYNHESPRRSPDFVGRKIIKSAVAIKKGNLDKLKLGDLSARVDWGAAEDTVEAMRAILNLDAADDFIVASGETHSIGEFVEIVFNDLRLDANKYVEVEPKLINVGSRKRTLVGSSAKLKKATGWVPQKSFEQIILDMIAAELAGEI